MYAKVGCEVHCYAQEPDDEDSDDGVFCLYCAIGVGLDNSYPPLNSQ